VKWTAAKLVMKGEAALPVAKQRPSVAHELHCNLAVCASTLAMTLPKPHAGSTANLQLAARDFQR
jgi:hypothetical protein